MHSAWIATVFGGEGAVGNPTGVVRLDGELEPARCQAIAARLGAPDTVFYWPAGEQRFHARFYSPSEAMSVCYQALIAAGRIVGAPVTTFACSDRELIVEHGGPLGWVRTPSALIERQGTVDVPGGLTGDVVSTGRRRAYAWVSAEGLERYALAASDALAWLQARALSGLCLVHEAGPGALSMRVFTTSLEGREDVATGGAAAGLPALLGREGSWTVHQGIGPAHRRGLLQLGADVQGTRVGGHCEIVLEGALV